MLATVDDHRGQRALRDTQELLAIQDRERNNVEDAALEQAEHQSRIGGILNIPMEDSDSDDSNYHDPMTHDHEAGGSCSVADKEVGDDPPTIDVCQPDTTSSVCSAVV